MCFSCLTATHKNFKLCIFSYLVVSAFNNSIYGVYILDPFYVSLFASPHSRKPSLTFLLPSLTFATLHPHFRFLLSIIPEYISESFVLLIAQSLTSNNSCYPPVSKPIIDISHTLQFSINQPFQQPGCI